MVHVPGDHCNEDDRNEWGPVLDEWGSLLDVGVLDVFDVGVDGSLVPVGNSTANDPSDARALTTEVIEALREVRARPGYRLGAGTDRLARQGRKEEISQPVLVRPGAAQRVINRGELFDEPIPALDVDPDSRVCDGDSYTWNATLRSGRFARRSACLYLHPTPSANVSILELIPSGRRRLARRRFVRRGVRAVDTLGRRLRRLSVSDAAAQGT